MGTESAAMDPSLASPRSRPAASSSSSSRSGAGPSGEEWAALASSRAAARPAPSSRGAMSLGLSKMGEPIMDFVFPRPSRRHAEADARKGDTPQMQPHTEEKDAAEHKHKQNKSRLSDGHSLDATDPVRDLLALCTPRRADVIDASAAIRERVAISQQRIKTVKAGGSFSEMDSSMQYRQRVKEIQQLRNSNSEGADAASAALLRDSQLDSAVLGSSLMESAFLTLSKLLNAGSIGPNSDRALLQEFQQRALGGPFPHNFEGNSFQELPAHPLLTQGWGQANQHHTDEEKEQTATGQSSPRASPRSTHRSSSPSATPRAHPSAVPPASSTRRHLLPMHAPHAPPASLSFHALRATLQQSFGTKLAHELELAGQRRKREAKEREQAKSARRPVPPLNLSAGDGSASARRGRSRVRSRSLSQDFSVGSGATSAGEREYHRAVAASKWRREHNQSPTSHWLRLQDTVQQRCTQAKALSAMAYFDAGGHMMQQEGMQDEAADGTQKEKAEDATAHSFYSASRPDDSGTVRFGPSSSRTTASGGGISPRKAALRSFHSGQILRQVANTNWSSIVGEEDKTEESRSKKDKSARADNPSRSSSIPSPFASLPSDIHITKRAELTLARSYANFDLAKSDLKSRLFESLALMDSERPRLLFNKAQHFAPGFLRPESDILQMRAPAEKRRQRLLKERMESLEKLHELIQYMNAQNASDGLSPSAQSDSQSGATAITLPTFEEIYLIDVLASLVDSSIPLLAWQAGNVLSEVVTAQEFDEEAPVRREKMQQEGGAIHPALLAMHAKQTTTGSDNSNATSRNHSRAGSTIIGSAAQRRASAMHSSTPGTESGTPSFNGAAYSHPSVGHPALIHPATPPPGFLLLLLLLHPSVFSLKEVRELLDKWARLCGVGDEQLEAALKMVGVDPRLATYSGALSKTVQLSAAHMLLLGDNAMDAAKAAATRGAPLLSSVVLAPVSLGDWDRRMNAERVRQNARDVVRRAQVARELTLNSSARTRIALGIGAKGTAQRLDKMQTHSPRPPQHAPPSARGSQPHAAAYNPADPRFPSGSQSARSSASHSRHQFPAFSQGVPLHPPPSSLLLRRTLSVLSEESGSPSHPASPARASQRLQQLQNLQLVPAPREMPRKHATGVARTISQKEKEEKLQLTSQRLN